MKKLISLLALLSSLLFSHNITVQISNVEGQTGEVLIGLYNKAEGFTLIEKVYQKGKIENISNNFMTYIFTTVPSGEYAISIFHDENSNRKLDKNFFGIPKEGYGFSNNLRPALRSATFEESMFKLNEDINLTIDMGY